MGPCGPGPGPYEGEKFKGKPNYFKQFLLSEIDIFYLHITFLNSFHVFFRFLAEIRFRTIMKLLRKQVLEPKRAVWVPPSPCLKQQSEERVYFYFRP